MMKRTIKLNARETLTATLKIQRLAGNASGYFSLIGEIRDSRRRRDDGIVAWGCLHDEILKAWPDLADAVALHLSDEDGAPMHAAANGWYWYAGAVVEAGLDRPEGAGRYIGETVNGRAAADIFADHCRISRSLADELIQQRLTCQQFHEWIGTQRERWKGQAEIVKQRYGLS